MTLGGRQEVSGEADLELAFDNRIITGYPREPVNPKDVAIRLCVSQLHSWGYRPEVWADGTIRVILPKNDSYGPVLREIARAYLLAIESPNPRRPQQ